MNIFEDVIHNAVLALFPLFVYLIYTSYKNITNAKSNDLIFSMCLFTSLYLCLRLGNIEENDKILLFCNIPIVAAYLKRKGVLGIILSLFVVCYCFFILNQNVLILLLKYISYYLVYFLCEKKKKNDNLFLSIIAVLQGFFVSFEFFYKNPIDNINTLVEIFMIVFLFYITSFLALYIFKVGEKMMQLHLTVKELEKEKQIKNSLFKITHEIKNPIAVCKGYLDMFDASDIEKSRKYADIIKNEIDRTLNILKDFLELSKIKIEKEEVDINMLLEEVCDSVVLLAKNKKIQLDYHPLEEDVYLLADYHRIKQVLINVIKNAMEAIETEGTVKIHTEIQNNDYVIEIIDNGCGMSEETLQKVSELFFTTKAQGTGLGVALSKEIVQLHNGKMTYTSKEKVGTKVNITLPLSS